MSKESTSPTINDVARIAGVSKRTVSRVLNDSPKVNQKTREQIQKVIKQLKYVPSPQARGLASSRSYMLGLLYDDPNALFIHAVQRGILSVCVAEGYELVVHPCDHLARNLVSGVKKFITRSKLDGVVILPPLSANEKLAAALDAEGFHYVRLAALPVDRPERIVISDDRAVMVDLARHFAELGHRDIAMITGPKYRLASEVRFEGFRQGLEDLGLDLPPDNIVEGDFTYESGIDAGMRLLDRPEPPTAIFASNDEMAAGVIHAAWQLGIKVPQQLSVAGYDDSPLASKIVPPLTTFRRHNERMAALAVKKLLASIAGRPDEASELTHEFAPELILRQSSGPVRG
ncbi:LacI family transcriptional regulator [Parahaliea maris]|uniref:LacI family transcriptional regulator n=1 Tax=Parahaliea maris TaxID=2716870 RepID=A0A5C9A7S8_9GAMM|nr:LacI family DNA-binding transcriptional regulator [Parahaliea maris]TXS96084.1 LacI family transcriptional regulator [Parahaliea maris]